MAAVNMVEEDEDEDDDIEEYDQQAAIRHKDREHRLLLALTKISNERQLQRTADQRPLGVGAVTDGDGSLPSCSLKDLTLRYDTYRYFVHSQLWPAWILWTGRCLLLLPTAGVAISQLKMRKFVHPPWLYMTNLTPLGLTAYLALCCFNTLAVKLYLRRRMRSWSEPGYMLTDALLLDCKEEPQLPLALSCLLRAQWLLMTCSFSAAFASGFSALDAMQAPERLSFDSSNDPLVSPLACACVLIEMLLSGTPVRLLHAVYVQLLTLLYCCALGAYWLLDVDSNVLYPQFMFWNYGVTISFVCLGATVLYPLLLQLLLWFICYFRERLCELLARCLHSKAADLLLHS